MDPASSAVPNRSVTGTNESSSGNPIRPPESVWDYPRPPSVEDDHRRVRVMVGETALADSVTSVRVLETSHPPVFYLPRQDVDMSWLLTNAHMSVCEYKGRARYFDLCLPDRVVWNVAWTYPDPSPGYDRLRGMIAFYPSRVSCYVDEVSVTPQEGDFYGGWITPEITGPFKGAPGTSGW